MLELMVKCTICDEILSITDLDKFGQNALQSHLLSHIPPPDVFDLLQYFSDWSHDERFEHRKDEIQALVKQSYVYDEFERFENLWNSDEWFSQVLEAAWDILDEFDDTINWGEQDIPQDGKLRQAISRIVHKYVTEITKDILYREINGMLVVLDEQRIAS